jgi:serine-type D-Ala-D-Ala carboxypeptidase/endopeptidase
MNARSVFVKGIAVAAAMATVLSAAGPTSPAPGEAAIRAILADRIDTRRQGVGMVVGVIDAQGRRLVVAHGKLGRDDPRTLNGDTVFEIGSVTKVFTSLLLADMVQRGDVALNDPVTKYLPAGTKLPERGGRQIALIDLSTHTSGLPRMPTNFHPQDPLNPYADYTVAQLYEFLAGCSLSHDIGTGFEYSNLGGGLLGHVLARRAGLDYDTLVRRRITGPLGMNSTAVALSPDMRKRLAPGHNANLETVPNWDLPTLAGAGALRSTADDMLTFLAAQLGQTRSPLAPAISAMLAVRRPTGNPSLGEIALGWLVTKRFDDPIVWHNGGTGGYRSFVGFNSNTRIGVVALSNTSTPTGVDDIGMHLLDSRIPLQTPPREHREKPIDPNRLDGLVGRYQLAPGFVLAITRDGGQLYAQATGQGKLPIYAESDREFFYKAVDAQLTFEVGDNGVAIKLTLHQNGANILANRLP